MASYPLETLVNWANSVADRLGSEWADSHIPPAPHRSPHIIASWIDLYRRTPEESLMKCQQLLQLSNLGRNIHLLEMNGVAGLQDRINCLLLDDDERVKSAIHEILVAANFALAGHRVMFIPECNTPTPDILVDDCIEVECKHKCGVSQRDKARYDLYGVLERKLRRNFHENIPHTALRVRTSFDMEPTRHLIDEVIFMCRKALQNPNPTRTNRHFEGEMLVEVETLLDNPSPSGTLILHDSDRRDEFDYISAHGKVLDANPAIIYLSIGCSVRQDRAKSILQSIKSAIPQFSRKRPAIISLDISETFQSIEDDHVPHLRSDINNLLGNNSSISQIHLEANVFQEPDGKLSLNRIVDVIDNPEAKYRLGN